MAFVNRSDVLRLYYFFVTFDFFVVRSGAVCTEVVLLNPKIRDLAVDFQAFLVLSET